MVARTITGKDRQYPVLYLSHRLTMIALNKFWDPNHTDSLTQVIPVDDPSPVLIPLPDKGFELSLLVAYNKLPGFKGWA